MVAERRGHQSAMIAVDGEMVGKTIGSVSGVALSER
jgi:hypothetical protein